MTLLRGWEPLGLTWGDVKPRTLVPFTHSSHTCWCGWVTGCCTQLTANTPSTYRASRVLGDEQESWLPCPKGAPASSERQISSQESGQWGNEELGAVQPSLQMQSPGASPSFEDLLLTPYPALVPPGLRQNLAFLPRNPSFLQIDGFYLDP